MQAKIRSILQVIFSFLNSFSVNLSVNLPDFSLAFARPVYRCERLGGGVETPAIPPVVTPLYSSFAFCTSQGIHDDSD